MPIPLNIKKEHILKAIERIKKEGVPANRQSTAWVLIYNDNNYPPKLVISYANYFANGEELNPNPRIFQTMMAKSYLEGLGFTVKELLKK